MQDVDAFKAFARALHESPTIEIMRIEAIGNSNASVAVDTDREQSSHASSSGSSHEAFSASQVGVHQRWDLSQSESSEGVHSSPSVSDSLRASDGGDLSKAESELPSLGAQLHWRGTCTPCCFFRSRRSCIRGADCRFCHLAHEDMTYSSMRGNMRKRRMHTKMWYDSEARIKAGNNSGSEVVQIYDPLVSDERDGRASQAISWTVEPSHVWDALVVGYGVKL